MNKKSFCSKDYIVKSWIKSNQNITGCKKINSHRCEENGALSPVCTGKPLSSKKKSLVRIRKQTTEISLSMWNTWQKNQNMLENTHPEC